MDTLVISKEEHEPLKQERERLKNRKLYQRLAEFEKNISTTGKRTRADLGF